MQLYSTYSSHCQKMMRSSVKSRRHVWWVAADAVATQHSVYRFCQFKIVTVVYMTAAWTRGMQPFRPSMQQQAMQHNVAKTGNPAVPALPSLQQ